MGAREVGVPCQCSVAELAFDVDDILRTGVRLSASARESNVVELTFESRWAVRLIVLRNGSSALVIDSQFHGNAWRWALGINRVGARI